MDYVFSALTQALLNSGQLVQVISKAGHLLPLVRDPVTGRFVEIAIGTISSSDPLVMPVQLISSVFAGIHNHFEHKETRSVITTGVDAIRGDIKDVKYAVDGIAGVVKQTQQTLGVLQATTALIGIGTVANLAISAVSLQQILQLREDVRQMRVEIKDGFIDLKKALKDQGAEILNRIDEVAQDIKFEQHRIVLIRAYGRFLEATKLMQSAVACEDIEIRDKDLANARQILVESLADYRNPHLLSETSPLGKLRRMECSWAIEQTIIMTYQIQKQSGAVIHRLNNLQASIRQDIVDVSNSVRSQSEIDFIYPEIRRICTQDLLVLSSWQDQAEWIQSLPASDLKLLESSELIASPLEITSSHHELDIPEQEIYDDIKPKSHFDSLRDQLQLMAMPELRLKYEHYVTEKAQSSGHKALKSEVLNQSSDMAIANLYHYFQGV
jgi:hypothetical protein